MPLHDIQILVIDDTPSIRTFLKISLEVSSAQFFEAGTAAEGLRLCREKRPHLIILDLGLPDKDGLDILPELKQPDADGFVPKVIILSVRKEQRIKTEAAALGADAYVTKPFLVEELMETIHKTLHS